MAKVTLSLILATVLVACLVPMVDAVDDPATQPKTRLLVDFGNGCTEWYDIPSDAPGTLEGVLLAVLGDRVTFSPTGDSRTVSSVDGVETVTVGTGLNRQECGWRIYAWNTVEWEFLTTDVSDRYGGGFIALAYYPHDTLVPASNPDYPVVWTSYKGDSSASGVSQSVGPDSVATPLEWYQTYAGAVDCSILYADGMIYHTVAGKYGSVGMDSLARIVCLDPVNRELMWSVTYSNSGNIEITTPVIVGDLILISSGNWHVYCLDRFTGEGVAELAPVGDEGDMCKGSKVTSYIPRKNDPSINQDRIHLEAGVANMAYDSGALYLNTSDGLVRCFSIDRENGFREIWTFNPPSDVKGCFYYHPPVIMESDGRRVLMAGNYSGGLMCVDAGTGEPIWTSVVKDLSGNRVGQASNIVDCGDGRALVCYSGGEMASTGGGVMLVDVTDGSVVWQKDIRCGKPVAVDGRFYAYISATADTQYLKDYRTGQDVEVVSGYYSIWIDDCSLFWVQDTDALSIGGITYSAGRLYSMDYSPGTEGADGGHVWCIDSDTGSVVWRVKVSPYSGNAYSMCAPTVVDGMVLVGNDHGAVYVLSETSSSEKGRSENIDYQSEGLAHWSWYVAAVLCLIVLLAGIHAYRK